jgi:hypothetical protein
VASSKERIYYKGGRLVGREGSISNAIAFVLLIFWHINKINNWNTESRRRFHDVDDKLEIDNTFFYNSVCLIVPTRLQSRLTFLWHCID